MQLDLLRVPAADCISLVAGKDEPYTTALLEFRYDLNLSNTFRLKTNLHERGFPNNNLAALNESDSQSRVESNPI